MFFDWSPISNKHWQELLSKAPRANLLQSWPYAFAARMHDQMMSRRAVISEAGEIFGLMQIQEVKVGPIHIVKLHRGPLWFDQQVSPERWRRFFAAFNDQFPKRIGRWRQILPELDDGKEAEILLRDAGLRRKGSEPYRTIMLDLEPGLANIRKAFKGKWRNALCQAERSGIEAVCDKTATSADRFLAAYAVDKTMRGYHGPTPSRLATMVASAAPEEEALIINAVKNGKTVASVLMFCHGQSATYQAGWTSQEGRACRAHHLLLWTAIVELKDRGVTTLDLGGIHPEKAAGVTRFKHGLGGRPVTLVGLYG